MFIVGEMANSEKNDVTVRTTLKFNSCCCASSVSHHVIGLINMTDVWRLDTLPSDVLILIFDYCHAFDLVRLSEVCKRFYDIIREETLWIKKSKLPIATNQTSRKFRERYNRLCSNGFSVCNVIFDRYFWLFLITWLCLRFYTLQT